MNVITNFRVYDLEETLISSGYAMIEEYDEQHCIEQASLLKRKRLMVKIVTMRAH